MSTRKFKVPRTMRINGKKWTIKVGANLHLDDVKVMGVCDFVNYTIHIDKDLSDQDTRETFLHEYMHALFQASGVHSEEVPYWIEHVVITAMENDMLSNNRVLFKALFS